VQSTDDIDSAALTALSAFVESYARRRPVERVVVVGNAPLGPSAERRDLVEDADLVVRCNSFVLDEPGEAPCAGRRTDAVVFAPRTRVTRWFLESYTSRAYLMVNNTSRVKRIPEHPHSFPDDLGFWPLPHRIVGLPLRQQLMPERNGTGAVPTTGTTAAFLARVLFPDARLYLTGFSFVHEPEQKSWAHRWGTVVGIPPAHRLDREGALLRSWFDEGHAVLVP
jgi:hypothetical protein